MQRKLVYLAHPLSGNWDGNIACVKRYLDDAVRLGWLPIAPYVMFNGLLVEPQDRELGLDVDFNVIERADELWLLCDRVSSGMQLELEHAVKHGKKIRRFPDPSFITEPTYVSYEYPNLGYAEIHEGIDPNYGDRVIATSLAKTDE